MEKRDTIIKKKEKEKRELEIKSLKTYINNLKELD